MITMCDSHVVYRGFRITVVKYRPCDLYGKCHRYRLKVYKDRREIRPLPITFIVRMFNEEEEFNPGQPDVMKIYIEDSPLLKPVTYWVDEPSEMAKEVLAEAKHAMWKVISKLLGKEPWEIWVWWDKHGNIHSYWEE